MAAQAPDNLSDAPFYPTWLVVRSGPAGTEGRAKTGPGPYKCGGKLFPRQVADQAWPTRCRTRALVTVEVRSKANKSLVISQK